MSIQRKFHQYLSSFMKWGCCGICLNTSNVCMRCQMGEFFRSGDMLGSGSGFCESSGRCFSSTTEANLWLVSWDSVKHSTEELEFCFLGLTVLTLPITTSPAKSKPFNHVFRSTFFLDKHARNFSIFQLNGQINPW